MMENGILQLGKGLRNNEPICSAYIVLNHLCPQEKQSKLIVFQHNHFHSLLTKQVRKYPVGPYQTVCARKMLNENKVL